MGDSASRTGQAIDRQYHTDSQGTVAALTSGALGSGGAGIATLTFDAWGVPLAVSGPGDTGGGPPPPPTLVNAGFETPGVGSGSGAYAGNPTGPGVGWTFSGSAGVSGNGSAFTGGNPDAPEGSQVGFLQITGSCSQPVTLAVAGTLAVSFLAAYRENTGDGSQTVGKRQKLGALTAVAFSGDNDYLGHVC